MSRRSFKWLLFWALAVPYFAWGVYWRTFRHPPTLPQPKFYFEATYDDPWCRTPHRRGEWGEVAERCRARKEIPQ